MDFYCINRGRLLDNDGVKTLEGPGQHSVHCLVDPGVCRNSEFEILFDPINPDAKYTRGFRLSDSAKKQTLALARAVGSRCSTCDGSGSQVYGFRASFNFTVIDLGDSMHVPPTVNVTNVIDSTISADPCADVMGIENIMDVADVVGIPGDDD